MAEARTQSPFSIKVVAAIVLGGVLAFLGFLYLSAYAPQIKAHGDCSNPTESKAATGLFGIGAMMEKIDGKIVRVTQKAGWAETPGLMVVPLQEGVDQKKLRELIDARASNRDASTLIVLPKWLTLNDSAHRGWVRQAGVMPPDFTKELIGKIGKIDLKSGDAPPARITGLDDSFEVFAPPQRRWLTGAVEAVLKDDAGRIILGRVTSEDEDADPYLYILADPDLIANHGVKSLAGAEGAVAILQWLKPDAKEPVAFDYVLTGCEGGGRNLLQLMFEPPFLALTIAVLAAALLVGIHAFGRFGPPLVEARAIPFGKRALADNAAILIARAGAVRRMGDRYVVLTRDAAAAALGATTMDAAALEAWLAALPNIKGPDFGTLAAAARAAKDSLAMRSAAQALHEWRNEVTRDR